MAVKSMLLYGRNSVLERLRVNPRSVRGIWIQENIDLAEIEELAESAEIPLEKLSAKSLSKMKPAKDLQGVVARVDVFRYAHFETMLKDAIPKKSTIIFLDRVADPHNLGVVMRTAACFGDMAVVIPERMACGVNETVLHVSSGGENYVRVSMVPNISSALLKAKRAGYWAVGAVAEEGSEDISEVSLPFPLALVLGSEGSGIRHGLDKHLDIRAHIRMGGAKLSFNVNIACAIFCYEICRQKGRNR